MVGQGSPETDPKRVAVPAGKIRVCERDEPLGSTGPQTTSVFLKGAFVEGEA